MSAHLTEEELTDNLLGVSSLTVNAHLLSCPTCADELEQVKKSIICFRSAAHAWGDSALASADRRATLVRQPRPSWIAPSWIIATAAVMLFAAVSAFYFYERHTGTQARATPVAIPSNTIETMQTQIDRDNQLLSQVNSELGEAVPAPMQPLRVSESVASSSLQTSSSGKRN